MKNILLYLFLASLALSSCNLLDFESPNDLDASTAITDASSAEAALLGIYSSMQRDAYYGGTFPLLTEPLCNNAETGGFQVISLEQLREKQVTPSNLFVEETWIAMYRTIANCNFLLEALPKVTDLEAVRAQQIEGQARAIRALAHFDLLRTFGEHWNTGSKYGIPLISRLQTIDDRPVRATVLETYTFILEELNKAIVLLDGTDPAGVQYMNQASVTALASRVYLYKKDYTLAISTADAVLQNPAFALLPAGEYASVFNSRRTSESIFELAFDNQNRSAFNGYTYSRDEALRPEIFYLAAASLDAFFQGRPGDVRAGLVNFSPDDNDATILPDGRTQKYRGEDTKDNPAYIIRLAEMYLIQAEARGFPDGVDALNALRTQRGLDGIAPADAAAFLQALLDERRAEFNFEGHYYSDLARLGQYEAVTGAAAFRAVLPIPNREIIASGGNLEQNPGY